MSLIISLGSNLGDRVQHLNSALEVLKSKLDFVSKSSIYESEAVDYLNQPSFLNQVIEFKAPVMTPQELIRWTLKVEKDLGRVRKIDKGPRTVDIDILFWGKIISEDPDIIIPHPRWLDREFIKKPLSELPYYSELKKEFGDFANDEFKTVSLYK